MRPRTKNTLRGYKISTVVEMLVRTSQSLGFGGHVTIVCIDNCWRVAIGIIDVTNPACIALMASGETFRKALVAAMTDPINFTEDTIG